MNLQAPPFDAATDVVADWIELKTLSLPEERLPFSDLERAWERSRLSEHEDYQGGVLTFDEWLEPITQQLQQRSDVLGSSYPFGFSEDSLVFQVSRTSIDEWSVGEASYLLCLFLSSFPESEIFHDLPKITPHLRDLFQAVAAWAAAGLCHGSAYAFGHPRPDEPTFLGALRRVYETLMDDSESVVVDVAPLGASGAEKDAGIDIIAWRPRKDKCSGKFYMLGQVATGKNWKGKSVTEYVKSLHENWFTRVPVSPPLTGMFIPFSIPAPKGGTVADAIRFISPRYGAVIYRDILAAYAEDGVNLASTHPEIYCHRTGDIPALKANMARYVQLLRRAQG